MANKLKESEAKRFFKSRSNDAVFEEWGDHDLNRECIQEQCSYEEALEAITVIYTSRSNDNDKALNSLLINLPENSIAMKPNNSNSSNEKSIVIHRKFPNLNLPDQENIIQITNLFYQASSDPCRHLSGFTKTYDSGLAPDPTNNNYKNLSAPLIKVSQPSYKFPQDITFYNLTHRGLLFESDRYCNKDGIASCTNLWQQKRCSCKNESFVGPFCLPKNYEIYRENLGFSDLNMGRTLLWSTLIIFTGILLIVAVSYLIWLCYKKSKNDHNDSANTSNLTNGIDRYEPSEARKLNDSQRDARSETIDKRYSTAIDQKFQQDLAQKVLDPRSQSSIIDHV